MYIKETCTTFDAVYENLPAIDTLRASEEEKWDCGLVHDNRIRYRITECGTQNFIYSHKVFVMPERRRARRNE